MNFWQRLRIAFRLLWKPEYLLYDPLTGAYRRKVGEEFVRWEISKAERGAKFTLAFIDIDGLKRINDIEGHSAGDKFLIKFVEITKTHLRRTDALIRYGGDEFIVLFPNLVEKETKKIMQRMQKTFTPISWGIIEYKPGETLETLIKKADEEMYRQKRNKKQ